MSIPESLAPLDPAFALLERYVRGEVPIAEMVAAFRDLPAIVSGDMAVPLGQEENLVAMQERLDALVRALADTAPRRDRAG